MKSYTLSFIQLKSVFCIVFVFVFVFVFVLSHYHILNAVLGAGLSSTE